MKKIINYLTETIKKEKALLTFIIITFIIGIVFGSLFINFISSDDKKLLIEQVVYFFDNVKKLSKDVFGMNVIMPNFLNNLFQILSIFILGISMIGIIVVVFVMFFKGFTLGITLSTIILKYQLKGVIGALLYVFPCFIINILIYVFISFFAVNASIKFLKALLKKNNLNFKSFLGRYVLAFLVSIIFMLVFSILDSFITPLLLKLFTLLI